MEVIIMGILQDRVAIITGSGSGLGKETAIAFAQEGAHVIVSGRTQQTIDETVQLIRSNGGSAIAVRTDVGNEADVINVVRTALHHYGKIDILINNAAVVDYDFVADTSLEAWEAQLRTNLTGPFLMIREVLAAMRKQQYGRIINITSALSSNGAGGYAAYSASKAGLESLTRTTAEEENRHHILVNILDPGMVRSGMHATGKDPSSVTPDIIRLASLPNMGTTGQLIVAG
jgi:3-oxoacyl-[acyl-carrier protein] reductase